MRSLSRSARSPDLPTAMTMRPQLASSPAIAVLTSGELATARPILRAAPLDEAPPTLMVTNLVAPSPSRARSEEHTSELQSHVNLVCRLLLEKKKKKNVEMST